MRLCPFNEFVPRIFFFFFWDSVHFKLSFLSFPFFVICYYCLRPYLVGVIPLIRTVYLLFVASILTLFIAFLLLKNFPLWSFDEIQDFFCVILWRNLWSFFPHDHLTKFAILSRNQLTRLIHFHDWLDAIRWLFLWLFDKIFLSAIDCWNSFSFSRTN